MGLTGTDVFVIILTILLYIGLYLVYWFFIRKKIKKPTPTNTGPTIKVCNTTKDCEKGQSCIMTDGVKFCNDFNLAKGVQLCSNGRFFIEYPYYTVIQHTEDQTGRKNANWTFGNCNDVYATHVSGPTEADIQDFNGNYYQVLRVKCDQDDGCKTIDNQPSNCTTNYVAQNCKDHEQDKDGFCIFDKNCKEDMICVLNKCSTDTTQKGKDGYQCSKAGKPDPTCDSNYCSMLNKCVKKPDILKNQMTSSPNILLN